MLSVGLIFITDAQFYEGLSPTNHSTVSTQIQKHEKRENNNTEFTSTPRAIQRTYTKIEHYNQKKPRVRSQATFLNFLDQRDRIQKKTFTKWMNQYLSKVGHRVDDLYEDLRDGVNLIVLLEILSGDKIVSR